jgi:hypothetical protein
MQALQRTFEKRPEMLTKFDPSGLSKRSKAFWQDLVKKLNSKA